MNKSLSSVLIVFGVFAAIGIGVYLMMVSSFNSMVDKEENVAQAWSQVQNVYQRRSDLIPNVVNVVKGVSNFEKSTITEVVEARAKATSMNISVEKLDENSIKQFQEAQAQLSGSLSRLLAVTENYPQLTATQAYRDLIVELEGTENRISTERRNFNKEVQEYNSYIRKFPAAVFAGLYGFDKKAYFEADAGADKVKEIKF